MYSRFPKPWFPYLNFLKIQLQYTVSCVASAADVHFTVQRVHIHSINRNPFFGKFSPCPSLSHCPTCALHSTLFNPLPSIMHCPSSYFSLGPPLPRPPTAPLKGFPKPLLMY